MAARLPKIVTIALSTFLVLSVAGCSGYDVELKGGVFDALGVAGVMNKKQKEKKVAARPGLVVPPSTSSLPKPGSAPQAVAAAPGENWPIDPEERKAGENRRLIAEHKVFCAKARQRVSSGITTVLPDGPMGSCHESIIKNFTGKDLFRRKADKPKSN